MSGMRAVLGAAFCLLAVELSVSAQAQAQRGTLVGDFPDRVTSLTASQLQDRIAGPERNTDVMFQGIMRMPTGKGILDLIGTKIKCGVDVWYMQFNTVGGAGEPTIVSGAIMTPSGQADCAGPRPVVLYARSTSMPRNVNIADLNQNYLGEPEMLAGLFASQGYIVVATNYAGYEKSTLPYHPYLNADQQSKEMIDALAAARSALAKMAAGVTSNGKVLISGYSQGGFVAMATHKAMQELGMDVAASAPGAGPFAMGLFGDNLFRGIESTPADTLQLPLLLTGFQKSYGDIYKSPSELFRDPYANGIEGLLPSNGNPAQLFKDGRLPQRAVFSDQPPVAPAGAHPSIQLAFNSVTPPVTRTSMDAATRHAFGTRYLITNEARRDFLLDAIAFPDGAMLSTSGVGLPNPQSRNPLRRAFQRSDLRDWSPRRPVMLCSLRSNPWVPYKTNQQLMIDLWAKLPKGLLSSLDLEEDVQSRDTDFVRELKAEFQASRRSIAATAIANGATDDGQAALLNAYHHWLGEPLCMAASFKFFEDVLKSGK